MEDFRKKVYVSVSVILGSLVVFAIVVYFLDSALGAAAKEIIGLRQASGERVATLEALSELKGQAEEAAVLQKKIDALLPTQDALFSFTQYLDSLARARGISVTPAPLASPVAPSATAPGHATFSISLSGDSKNITDFLSDLEFRSTKFVLALDTITFLPESSGFRADVGGRIFFK
jgi:hypothetical protein